MSDLFEYFEEMGNKIKGVQTDILATIVKLEEEGKSDKRVISKNSIEPVTRLRSSVNEVNDAKENPEIQFIKDSINDIFK